MKHKPKKEARLAVSDADLDLLIRTLSVMKFSKPDHILRQLKAEQKRLFHPGP